MTELPTNQETLDVPAEIFEKFLQALREAAVPDELVARLRKVLVVERTFTDRALKAAVLGEEPLP